MATPPNRAMRDTTSEEAVVVLPCPKVPMTNNPLSLGFIISASTNTGGMPEFRGSGLIVSLERTQHEATVSWMDRSTEAR